MANNLEQSSTALALGAADQQPSFALSGHINATTAAAAEPKDKHQQQQRHYQQQPLQNDLMNATNKQQQPQPQQQRPPSSGGVVQCSCGRVLATTSPTTKTSSLSTMSTHNDAKGKPEQMTKLTKWLCAIILALVLVVLALVLLQAPYRWSSRGQSSAVTLSSHPFVGDQHPQYRSGHQQQQNPVEQGKLLASSSDDHYTRLGHTSDDDHHLDDINNDDDDDNNNDTTRTTTPGGAGDDPNDLSDQKNQVLKTPVDHPNILKQQQHHRTSHNNRLKVQSRDSEQVCTTPGCVQAAAQVLNNMNNTVKPCDDFYEFACGRWISQQVIPEESTSLSVFSENTNNLNQKLRVLIEQPAKPDDPPIVGEMRVMYASCMNLTAIEARGDEPLVDVLRFLGGWPVLTHRTSEATSTTTTTTTATTTTTTTATSSTTAPPNGGAQRRRRNNNNPSSPFRRMTRQTPTTKEEEPSTMPDSRQQPVQIAHWLDTLIKIRQRGFSHDVIIDLSVVPDVRNNRRYIIELDQSSLGLPDRIYYLNGMNDSTVKAYFNLMVESAVMLGAPRPEARRQMLEVLDFETSLARISVPREQRRNVTRLYNKMPLRDLYKLAPNIDWPKYLTALLKDNNLNLDEDEVIVKVPSFLQAIDELLINTNPRILTNYMLWRVVRHSMNSLSKKWRELAFSYSTVTSGRQVEESRWEQCLSTLDGTLGTALSALYVKNHFNGRSKESALEMVDYIRREFLKILEQIDWMDEETREEARKKAEAISTYIGYPDELLRDELIEDLYAGIKMDRNNLFQNIRNLRIWSTDYAFSQLRKPNKRGDWKKHARAAVVNAYYNALENSIEFPAGILQGAFFNAERPNYMNFGAIGYVIGHEITHGFDDRGRQFDSSGTERNWWKSKTDARFRERAQCIVEQYANYTVAENGLKVNGVNTQGENIADNGGIKQAFRAYRRWSKDHGREPRLPGLSQYTPDQLFWISAANIWCGKFRPEVLKLRVNSGVHSPARFRIIGPFSNSPEFARSFNCPLGSPMNPSRKCSVW